MVEKETGGCGDCCRVEAIVGVDERGQMILPKELRDKAEIKAGDKLAVISLRKDHTTCCLAMVKADQMAGMVKKLLGPLIEEITKV